MILGKHTLNETRDLLAVVDYRFKETEKTLKDTPNKPDDLVNDWNALFPKWVKGRDEVISELRRKALATVGASANVVATEPEYQKILSFFQGQELVKGSFQDIVNRLGKLRGAPLAFPNDPKQNSPDVDLAVFKELDTDIKVMEKNAAAAKQAAVEGAKEVAKSDIGLIIGGTIFGGIVLHAVAKKYL